MDRWNDDYFYILGKKGRISERDMNEKDGKTKSAYFVVFNGRILYIRWRRISEKEL